MSGELRYFCFGTALGVAAAILFTPTSGPETRALLNSKASDAADYVKSQADDARAAATDAVKRGKQAVKNQVDSVSAAVDAGQKAYQDGVAGNARS